MLPDNEIDALLDARHHDPYAALGMHAVNGRIWVRALLPGAVAVAVLDAKTGRSAAMLELRRAEGFFEAVMPRRRQHFSYRLLVQWANGEHGTYADAFSVGVLVSDNDLWLLSEGTHLRPYEVLGAHPHSVGNATDAINGVRFALWAPNARRVSVVGDFNGWDGRRHSMRSRGGSGIWEIFVPHAAMGDRYKFEILAADGQLLPLKSDPYARAAELRPGTASIVAAAPQKVVIPADRARANSRNAPISIYEVHAASWRKSANGPFPTWDELAESLPQYAVDLGFTHIELMPVSEHPFDGSWGYQTLGMYAVTSRFGPPAGFARFVAACHAMGLGVLLDWVPAHFPSDAHGLAQFDGTALYEYADAREGFHRDWNTLIYNFGRNEVRNFLAGSALYWIEQFGVDGLRVDAVASMLYRDYSRPAGEWIPNAFGGRENLEAIALLKRVNEIVGGEHPASVMVAEESTAFPGVTTPTFAGGLGFHFKWNMGWMNDTLKYIHEDPVHRRWHHDKMTFGLIYAFSENFVLPISHDEVVHGKGSMLAKMPGDGWQRFANLRAYYGFMWGHPGKKLLFMGQEFAQANEWNHDATLPWELLDAPNHRGVQTLIHDLNHLYRTYPALHRHDCVAAGFEWLNSSDADQSVFAWLRHGDAGEHMLVVVNMTPVPRHSYRVGVPMLPTGWREVLNTDAGLYGGSNVGNGNNVFAVESKPAQHHERSIALTLPPLAALFLVPA